MSGHAPEIQRLLDEREIRDVLARYCRGVDRADEALVASVYHPDAVDDHGVFRGSGAEFARLIGPTMKQTCDASQHFLGQSSIEIQGDRAHAETYVIAVHRRGDGEDVQLETFGARYLDRLSRRAGEWRIDERVVVNEWSRLDRRVTEPALAAQLPHGLRSPDDLAYRTEGSLFDPEVPSSR
jgi:hypothetical protein